MAPLGGRGFGLCAALAAVFFWLFVWLLLDFGVSVPPRRPTAAQCADPRWGLPPLSPAFLSALGAAAPSAAPEVPWDAAARMGAQDAFEALMAPHFHSGAPLVLRAALDARAARWPAAALLTNQRLCTILSQQPGGEGAAMCARAAAHGAAFGAAQGAGGYNFTGAYAMLDYATLDAALLGLQPLYDPLAGPTPSVFPLLTRLTPFQPHRSGIFYFGGPREEASGPHVDMSSCFLAWQLQLRGRKRWTTQSPLLPLERAPEDARLPAVHQFEAAPGDVVIFFAQLVHNTSVLGSRAPAGGALAAAAAGAAVEEEDASLAATFHVEPRLLGRSRFLESLWMKLACENADQQRWAEGSRAWVDKCYEPWFAEPRAGLAAALALARRSPALEHALVHSVRLASRLFLHALVLPAAQLETMMASAARSLGSLWS